MSTVVWAAIILAALPLAWWLLKVALAFAVPQRVSGIMLLKQELTKRGVSHSQLPAEFFEECIAWLRGWEKQRAYMNMLFGHKTDTVSKREKQYSDRLEQQRVLRRLKDEPEPKEKEVR